MCVVRLTRSRVGRSATPEGYFVPVDDGCVLRPEPHEQDSNDIGDAYHFLEIHEPLFDSMGALVLDAPAFTWEDMAKGWKALE